jgi:hypothetical protein
MATLASLAQDLPMLACDDGSESDSVFSDSEDDESSYRIGVNIPRSAFHRYSPATPYPGTLSSSLPSAFSLMSSSVPSSTSTASTFALSSSVQRPVPLMIRPRAMTITTPHIVKRPVQKSLAASLEEEERKRLEEGRPRSSSIHNLTTTIMVNPAPALNFSASSSHAAASSSAASSQIAHAGPSHSHSHSNESKGELDVLSQSQLAHRFGLTPAPTKGWRFRDFRRGLLRKLCDEHSQFIGSQLPHSMLRQRLPHKMSVRSFGLRLLLLAFHQIVSEGKVPSFWVRMDVDGLGELLPQEFSAFHPEVALRAHELIRAGLGVEVSIKRAQQEVGR